VAVKLYAVALLVLSGVGCQESTPPTKAATTLAAPADSAKPVADTWERSLRCSERADTVATRMQRDYAKFPQDAQVMSWVSHYNGKEARCFLKIIFWDRGVELKLKSKGLPVSYEKLYDAVEGLERAASTNFPVEELVKDLYCTVPSTSDPTTTIGVECSVADKYILERMTQ